MPESETSDTRRRDAIAYQKNPCAETHCLAEFERLEAVLRDGNCPGVARLGLDGRQKALRQAGQLRHTTRTESNGQGAEHADHVPARARVMPKMGWFGFWLCLSVFVICDHWVFTLGYDTLLLRHKTEAEKELQQLKIDELRRNSEGAEPRSAHKPLQPADTRQKGLTDAPRT